MVSFKIFVYVSLLWPISYAPSDVAANESSSKKSLSLGASQPPPPVSQHDIYRQLVDMSDLCEKVMDCVTEYEKQGVSEDMLLQQQRCNLMKTSCLTILYVAEAAEKAAFSQLAEFAESL